MAAFNSSSRKAEIERKLFEEQNKLAMLKESLEKADTLTHNMVTILDHFDERLHKLEDTILPVHRKTKDLQRLQDNIDKTISALNHVISYHHVARDVGPVLRQGPSRQVDRYLESMEKLVKAVEFFSENNPDSPELNTVTQLFDVGKEGLEKEFQGQLSRHTKPVPAEQLLQAKTESDGQITMKSEQKTGQQINMLPEKAVGDLTKIAKWLAGPGKSSGFTQTYAQIRSSNLLKTLIGLKDYVKDKVSSSGSKKHSNIKDTPRKSGARRPRILEKRKEALTKGSSYTPIPEEEVVEIDSDSFHEVVTHAESLFRIEQQLMQAIIPKNAASPRIFDSVIHSSLELLEQDGMKFVAYAKQCITRRDHTSVVNIFPAIKHLKGNLSKYNDVLKGTSENNRLKIPKLVAEMDSTGSKVLDDFTDSVKSDPEKESNMPRDGTVHELTSNAMLFLEQLAKDVDVAGGMLASQHHGGMKAGNKSQQCLSQYTSHVLGALKLNLENKSRVYVDQSLAAIFLLNNYNFILMALNRYGLLALVQLSTADIESIYKSVIEEQKKRYLRSWEKFTAYLSEDNKQGIAVNAQPGTRLKDKEKQVVKDKFKSFNNELDDVVKVHRTWAVPDSTIKTEIRAAVQKKIVPMYTAFRDRYRMVQFTKNIEKYLKHTPASVTECIERLFDQSTT